MSVLSAIKSAVANIENVIQVKAYENPTDTASILNDIFKIPAHGVAIIVDYNETNLVTEPVAYEIYWRMLRITAYIFHLQQY